MPETDEELQLLRELSLGAIANRCARETQRFFRRESYDPRFCFELFRRAAEDGDQRAWELVYEQYHALAHGWILRHSVFAETGLEPQEVLNQAFTRLWKAIADDNFARFDSLAGILQFLRLCIHSVIIDQARKNQAEQLMEEALRLLPETNPDGHNPGKAILDRDSNQALWEHVKTCLKSKEERVVVVDAFVYGLKPRQTYDRNRELFESVKDVHRVKQNVLSRLRRDPFFREHLGLDG